MSPKRRGRLRRSLDLRARVQACESLATQHLVQGVTDGWHGEQLREIVVGPCRAGGRPRSQLRGSAAHGARGPCAGLYELQASPGRRLWVNSEKLALNGVADERLPLDVSPMLPEGWDVPRSAGGNGRWALSG